MSGKNIFNQVLDGLNKRKEQRNKEKILFQEIDRIIKESGSKIYLAKRYRKKLLPTIQNASDAIEKMFPPIPGPVELEPNAMEDNPILDAIFDSPEDFLKWLKVCKSLREPLEKSNLDQITGLLVADYKFKSIFGSQIKEDLLIRDIPQKAILFKNPRIVVSAGTLAEAQKEFHHRILLMLVIQAMDEINELNLWKKELEQQHDLLSFKLGGSERFEIDSPGTDENGELEETEEVLEDIDEKLEEIGNDIDTPDYRLSKVINVLQSPGLYVQMGTFTIEKDRKGIWVKQALEKPEHKLTMAECKLHGDENRVLVWVRMKKLDFI